MITFALTNRNRDLRIVENCLNSLKLQSNSDFKVLLVDYGSEFYYLEKLTVLTDVYHFVSLIHCPVYNQLWNKSRAINIALRQTDSEYFLVGDIDLIFHPDFINKSLNYLKDSDAIYFKYAFLNEVESLKKQNFDDYKIDFCGGKEITGTTLFTTEFLKQVNGFDEFYHGWGAEDTDIHIRLKCLGKSINFIEDDILIKHQWHPKAYRSKQSTHPFHSSLERINHNYLLLSEANKITKVNIDGNWGLMTNKNDYTKLESNANISITIKNIDFEFSALLAQLKNINNQIVEVSIVNDSLFNILKNNVKKAFNRKYKDHINLETLNNFLLEELIKNYRNQPYIYSFKRNQKRIYFKIVFKKQTLIIPKNIQF